MHEPGVKGDRSAELSPVVGAGGDESVVAVAVAVKVGAAIENLTAPLAVTLVAEGGSDETAPVMQIGGGGGGGTVDDGAEMGEQMRRPLAEGIGLGSGAAE